MSAQRRARVQDNDRVFSRSSATAPQFQGDGVSAFERDDDGAERGERRGRIVVRDDDSDDDMSEYGYQSSHTRYASVVL